MNWKNVVLALSVVLNVGLLVYLATGGGPNMTDIMMTRAFAQNRTVSGGGFVLTTANITSSRRALYVIDNTEKRMIVYAFPSARGQNIEGIASRDLRKDFDANLAGELLMVPGEIPGGTEAVYVLDPVGKRLIVYNCRGTGTMVDVIGKRELGADFRAGAK